MPIYQDAAYAGQSLTLQNPALRIDIHKRLTGWGWAEFFTPAGKLMAVLEHFGELKIPGLDVPLRMEAADHQLEQTETGQRLTFNVKLTTLNDMVANTEFKRFVKSPFNMTALEGTVTITLDNTQPVAQLQYRFRVLADLGVAWFRGPWLKAGADSFGAAKTDAIFPGLEWLNADEWSSGTDHFQHPWALRALPHPFKVSIPVIALSHHGDGLGLAWNPLARVFSHQRYVQPVFASPNFIDRCNNHLLGLQLPPLEKNQPENSLEANPPIQFRCNEAISFDAEIFLAKGNSLDVLINWIQRHGLPDPGPPRYPLQEALERIAHAYNTNLWYEGKGWAGAHSTGIMREPTPAEPEFLERYIARNPNTPTAVALAEKLAWARAQPAHKKPHSPVDPVHLEKLLARQRPDGSFPFDPYGEHLRPNHNGVAAGTYKPFGKKGDTALDLCVVPAREMLIASEKYADQRLVQAACRALDFCLPMQRPEGGDWWETPLHSPNLLAAGNAAIAYYLGFRAVQKPEYLEKAIYWIRALLPFTHLWQPPEAPQLYNTKPCFTATCWWLSNWTTFHVQWEALGTFAASHRLGIDWRKIDPGIDWDVYQKGITVAALRWMVDHADAASMDRISFLFVPLEKYQSGALDGMYHDGHDCTNGTYRGGPLMPDLIAVNLLHVLQRETGAM